MDESTSSLLLYACLALVAVLYASVGHGGASGYLAVFAIFGIASPQIVPLVLVMNTCVACVSFWSYAKAGHFDVHLLLPFVLGSIPASYLGGHFGPSQEVFSIVLGIALVLAAARVVLSFELRVPPCPPGARMLWRVGVPTGIVLGFISGMIGIGGGVFLSPLLLLLRWADTRKTAAVASAFIVLNSLSGLVGHLGQGRIPGDVALPFLIVVLVGGLAGSHLGAVRIPSMGLRALLALVLVVAGAKLFGMD